MKGFWYAIAFIVGFLLILNSEVAALRVLGAWMLGAAVYYTGEQDGRAIGRRDALSSGRKFQ